MTPQDCLDSAVLGLFISPKGVNRPSTFLSSIYCSLKQSWNPEIETARVSLCLKLQINPEWFVSLSAPMRETLIAHELWHIALLHGDPARVTNKDPAIWNMACDYAINIMLLDHGYHFDKWPPGHPKEGKYIGLVDDKYRDMSSEQIYDLLVQESAADEGNFPKDLVLEEIEEIEPEDLAKAVQAIEKAITISKMAGEHYSSFPAEMSLQIERLLNPKLPWEQLLSLWLTEKSEYGATWSRPNRRYEDVYLPSMQGQEGLAHIRWYLDCSGSVTDEQLHVYNSEIVGAIHTHRPKRTTVSFFNEKITETQEFTEYDDIGKMNFIGRGGTSLGEVIADIAANKPEAAVIISDLRVPGYPPDPKVPILWICVDNPRAKVPYGKLVHLDSRF